MFTVWRGGRTHHTCSLAPDDALEPTRIGQRWGGAQNWHPGAPDRAPRVEVPPEALPLEAAASPQRQVARRAYPDPAVPERAGGDTAWELKSPDTSSFIPWGFCSNEPLLLFGDGVGEKRKEMRKDSFHQIIKGHTIRFNILEMKFVKAVPFGVSTCSFLWANLTFLGENFVWVPPWTSYFLILQSLKRLLKDLHVFNAFVAFKDRQVRRGKGD